MPGSLTLLRGPAGSGKSGEAKRMLDGGGADVLADFTATYAALTAVERGDDGRYPVRETSDTRIPITAAIVTAIERQALERGLRVVRTTSSSSETVIAAAKALADRYGADYHEQTIDPGLDEAADRLRIDGELSDECAKALDRWYGLDDGTRAKLARAKPVSPEQKRRGEWIGIRRRAKTLGLRVPKGVSRAEMTQVIDKHEAWLRTLPEKFWPKGFRG